MDPGMSLKGDHPASRMLALSYVAIFDLSYDLCSSSRMLDLSYDRYPASLEYKDFRN